MQTKCKKRQQALQGCAPQTQEIHEPIVDVFAVDGELNPSGLGDAEAFSSPWFGYGQSSTAFETLAEYRHADDLGLSSYHGAAEYGVVRSAAAAAVCAKMAALHGGGGAIVCPSGLAAITMTLEAFAPRAIALPEGVYRPVIRYVNWINERHYNSISLFSYPGGASTTQVEQVLQTARAAGTPIDMIYAEAPGSGTFEIPDLDGLVALAKHHGIRSVMDNTWATHVRFKPIERGFDVVIQATTKYEGGYGDTPSGVVIARTLEYAATLARTIKVLGTGMVALQTCLRLLHRIDSTEERMDRHYTNALQVMAWLSKQTYIADIICPALETSPDHERFLRYFGKGNGLFTIVFHDDVTARHAEVFMDSLLLFRIAEGWGGHVSLVLPVRSTKVQMIRFHIGLEDPADLMRDIEQAAKIAKLI